MSVATASEVEILGRADGRFAEILTPEAIAFVAELHREFGARRKELLAARAARQREFDAGKLPDFLAQTREIREKEWK
ncbi:MAG TPA: malate synthase A, partial [Burkholderiales bacterium]|nr:malate synthase A [Burkholderiales bacterium]